MVLLCSQWGLWPEERRERRKKEETTIKRMRPLSVGKEPKLGSAKSTLQEIATHSNSGTCAADMKSKRVCFGFDKKETTIAAANHHCVLFVVLWEQEIFCILQTTNL